KVDEDVRAARDRLRKALEAEDIDSIGSASHILISVAGAVGAARVAQGAQRINLAVNRRDLAAIRQAAPAMLEDIERMLEFVGHRLNA
ncbi:MAG TPA: Hpt domain-containing protein, partial [Thermohalobaculum sp.]|nr:Hpt domain-containing protein [Thermohalobaculum sp.]